MVSVDSFFVFGGGRWRALDAGSGRVEGWGRARFAVARAGQLLASRPRPVLAALRALAAGAPSAASAGPKLPYRFNEEARDGGGCKYCQCCQHSRTGTTEKASVAIQCGEDVPTAPSRSRLTEVPRDSKRKRDSTSSDEVSARALTTVASVHARRASDAGAGAAAKRKRPSTGTERGPAPKLRKPGPLNGKRSARESSALESIKISSEIRRENKISKYLRPKPKRVRKSSDDTVPRRTTRRNVGVVISSDDSDFESDRRRPESSGAKRNDLGLRMFSKDSRRKMEPKKIEEESSSDKRINNKSRKTRRQVVENNLDTREISSSIKHETGPARAIEEAKELDADPSATYLLSSTRKARSERAKTKESGATETRKYQETPRELVIEERDVQILRLFLQKHYPDEQLLRFDTNDEYKKMHFYQINPLVNVERCPQIDRMLRKRSQLSLVDFANKLGLRSITDASKPRRYRTRRQDKKPAIVDHATDSSIDKDKENFNRPTRSKIVKTDKVLKESLNKATTPNKEIGKIMEILELSSDESERRRNNKVKALLKKPKPKPTISTKRSSLKEYSSLEDHAIVSWVSTGGRACCVNGNRLWRELQTHFGRITGHSRTWHSLRNRYLRYILPRLGDLALPPAQQSRLRAAAATGELKARRREPRRNSMFLPPPRGASSRRPRPPPPDASLLEGGNQYTGKSPPRAASPPAPRYSDVTRHFARTHRPPSSDASLTHAREERHAHTHTSPRKTTASARHRNDKRSPGGARHRKTRSKSTSVSSERRTPSVTNRRKTRQKSPSVSRERRAPNVPNRRNTRQKSPSVSSERRTPSVTNRRKTRQKSPSVSRERRAPNVPNRRNTRQKSPSVSSEQRTPSVSNRRKTRQKSPSVSSERRTPSVTNRRKTRQKSPSVSRERRAPNVPNRRNTRQKSPSVSSEQRTPSVSNRRKTRQKSPSVSSERGAPSVSNRRKTRQKSPSVSSGRRSESSESNSDSSESSVAERSRRIRRSSRRRSNSDTSTDAWNDSSNKRPSPPRRRSTRHRSPREQSTRASPAHVTHESTTKSDHKSNRRHFRRKSSESSDEARHEPTESNRRQSNRLKPPSESIGRESLVQLASASNGRRSPVESNRRKSNRRRSSIELNTRKSPTRHESPTPDDHKSTRRKSPEQNKRLSLRETAKRKSALVSPEDDDHTQRMLRNRSPVKRTRKLFNPRALL